MTSIKDFDKWSTAVILALPKKITPVMDGLSFVGEPIVVLAIGSAGFISATARSQTRQQTAFILGAIAFSIGTLLKLLLKRRRPHGRVIRNFGINSYSFPSGHSFGSMIFYGLFALLDAKYMALPWSLALTILLSLLIFMIGVSRVYKGSHYPSDVLAGWLLGGISLVLINWLAF